MRVALRAVLALVVLAAAAVLLAPASLLDAPLAARTGGRLHLVDARGFWWRGQGQVATDDGRARMPLAWRVAFVPLLARSLVVELGTAADATLPTGALRLRDGDVEMHALRLTIPAALVPALVPALANVALRGDIDLHAPSFAWRRDAATGTFDATWQHARTIAGGFAVDLGSVSVSGAPAADGVTAIVRNAGGDVVIDGSVAVHASVIDASVDLAPGPGAPQALRTMLPLLGPADAAGRVRVAWRSDRR